MPVRSAEMLFPFHVLSGYLCLATMQRMTTLSSAYWLEWTEPTKKHVLQKLDTCLQSQPLNLPLIFKDNTCWIFFFGVYIAHKGELTELAHVLARRLAPYQLHVHVDDVSASAVLAFLRLLGTDLVVGLQRVPDSFCGALMRANICTHMALSYPSAFESPLTSMALLRADKLRVLSLGYLPDGIPPMVRTLCEQAPSLCYAGAYGSDPPIKVRNGLVPHPGCWTTKIDGASGKRIFPGVNNIIDNISFGGPSTAL